MLCYILKKHAFLNILYEKCVEFFNILFLSVNDIIKYYKIIYLTQICLKIFLVKIWVFNLIIGSILKYNMNRRVCDFNVDGIQPNDPNICKVNFNLFTFY